MDREDAFKLSHRGWHAALHAAIAAHEEQHGRDHPDAGAFALAAADAAFPDAAAQVAAGDTGEAAPEPAPAAAPKAQAKPAKQRETVAELHQRRAIESAATLRAMSDRARADDSRRRIDASPAWASAGLSAETLDAIAATVGPAAITTPTISERTAEAGAAFGHAAISGPVRTSEGWKRAFRKAEKRR